MSHRRIPVILGLVWAMFSALPVDTRAGLKPSPPRRTLSLDGQWQVEEGDKETRPEHFGHTVPVPGLLDLAEPQFSEVGQQSPRRQAFWYRRTFKIDGPLPL